MTGRVTQFRPPPPPRFGTPEFLEQARTVVRAKENLTPKQEQAANFWAGGEGTALPPGIWMQVVLERGRETAHDQAGRTLSLRGARPAEIDPRAARTTSCRRASTANRCARS